MGTTFLTNVETLEGEVAVITKTRFLFFFNSPRTSVMPSSLMELGEKGIQFQWATSSPTSLERLHNLLVQALQEVSLTELRGIADMGKQLMSIGAPFIPEDAPLPDTLKQLNNYIKRVI